MLTYIKKYWFLVLLGFIATVLGLINFFLPEREPQRAPQVQVETYKGIVPGQTKQEQLFDLLGPPDPKQSDFSKGMLSYPRDGGGPNHEATISNDETVVFFKEKSLSGSLPNYIQKYGQPEADFYGPEKEAGYKVYVWAPKGLAVIASENDGLIFEIWHFQSMTMEQFLQTWGEDLSTEYTHEDI